MSEDLFEVLKDYRVTFRFYEVERSYTVEELYQAFKTRMEKENSPQDNWKEMHPSKDFL